MAWSIHGTSVWCRTVDCDGLEMQVYTSQDGVRWSHRTVDSPLFCGDGCHVLYNEAHKDWLYSLRKNNFGGERVRRVGLSKSLQNPPVAHIPVLGTSGLEDDSLPWHRAPHVLTSMQSQLEASGFLYDRASFQKKIRKYECKNAVFCSIDPAVYSIVGFNYASEFLLGACV